MILAVDMGNSNIKIGVAGEKSGIIEERVTTAKDKTSMEYAMDILSILKFHEIRREEISGAIISSVVPPLSGTLATAVRKVTGKEAMMVSHRLKLPVDFSRMVYPEKTGADLIAGACAAYHFYGGPVIIVNMGTATTITVVTEDGRYIGGVILPGLKVSLDSLSRNTAQLPYISLSHPGPVIGKETIECMRSGILYGNAAQLDGLIERMEKELGMPCRIVATGGLARFVTPLCKREIILDRELLMKGLLEIYRENVSC